MIRTRRPHRSAPKRSRVVRRVAVAVCVGVMWSTAPILGLQTFSEAYAQASTPTNEALFLAVENNNLTGVRAAIKAGASVDAKDFNGMQPVDLAIDRGFFEIAHFLISVRNGDTPTAEIEPQPEAVAEAPVVEAPVIEAPAVPEPIAEVVQVEPKVEPKPVKKAAPNRSNAQTQTFNEVKRVDITKESATKRFLSTFMDFFKPANTTGIMRRKPVPAQAESQPLTAEDLNQKLQELEAELGPALQTTGKAEALKSKKEADLRDARIAEARNNRPTTAPQTTEPVQDANPFGEAPDMTGAETSTTPAAPTPRKVKQAAFDSSKPFNGQVDPDILNYLNNFGSDEAGLLDTPSAANDPFAASGTDTPATAEADPFALTDSTPQDVAVLEPQKPPSRATEDADPFATAEPADPFATAEPADPFATAEAGDPFASSGEGDVLKGLLDTSEDSGGATGGANGWDVKKVEGATIPNEVQLLATTEPTGNMLEGVELTLGADITIGQEVGEARLKRMKEDTIHRPCLNKGDKETIFCVDKVSWPFELEEDFLVDTIMYQGTSTVTRYDAGRATNFHSLFKSIAFPRVINYYITRFGQPSEVVQRAVAPLAKPRMDNPTYIWKSREAGTDTITSLEIRKFDDERGSFPDTRRGVIMLYKSHAGSIFPQLSQLELMVLKTNEQSGVLNADDLKEESIW